MLSTTQAREKLAVGVVLATTAAVSYLLPMSTYQSLLLVGFVVLLGIVAVVPGVWPMLYRTTGVTAGGWLLTAGAVASGFALSYTLGDPQVFCEREVLSHRGCLTAFGWASIAFLASSLGFAVVASHLGRYRRLRRASVVPAADVSEGLVAVEGRIVPAGPTLTGPVSDDETVWYRRAVEKATVFQGYREIEQETAGDELYVRDGSGRLLVLPEGLDDHDVAEHARSHTAADGDERAREWSYEPDDAVTVVGRASAVSRAEYSEPVVVGLDGPVLVGRRSLSDLRVWAAQRVIGGAVAAVICGLAFLAMVLTV